MRRRWSRKVAPLLAVLTVVFLVTSIVLWTDQVELTLVLSRKNFTSANYYEKYAGTKTPGKAMPSLLSPHIWDLLHSFFVKQVLHGKLGRSAMDS